MRFKATLFVLLFSFIMVVQAAYGEQNDHPPVQLKNEQGEVINPLQGKNENDPYSPQKTCGSCHDYSKITEGYHFQQGWEVISDDFSSEKPYVLSPGMMGKW